MHLFILYCPELAFVPSRHGVLFADATIISMPSLLSATAVTLIGMITNVLMKFRKIWIFVTGVIYITAGIFTFTCLVLYITYIMQELDHKKDEKGEDGESLFSLRYGYSVILAMVSFCCQELGGVGLIYLSIARFRAHWDAKDQQLAQRTLEFNLNNARFPPCISVPLPAQPFPACQPNFHGHTSRQGRHGSLEQIQMHAPLHGNTPNWHTRSTTHSSTCSPRLHRKSMTDPDLDVRTRDMYIGNHINCSYNSTYRTPFGLDLAPKSIYEKPRQPRRERTMLFAKTAPRQVTFSDEELDVVMDSYSGSSLRSNVPQSAGGLPPRRIRRALRTESLRMTPV